MFSEEKPLIRVEISICGTFINQTPAYIHYRRPTPPTFTRYRRLLYTRCTRQPVYQTRSGKWLLPVVTRRHFARYRYLNNSNKDLGIIRKGKLQRAMSSIGHRIESTIGFHRVWSRYVIILNDEFSYIRFFNLWKNSHLKILRKWNWFLKFNYKFLIIK